MERRAGRAGRERWEGARCRVRREREKRGGRGRGREGGGGGKGIYRHGRSLLGARG